MTDLAKSFEPAAIEARWGPVWAAAVRDETYRASPVRLYEFTDEEYAFLPVNLALRANIGRELWTQLDPGYFMRPAADKTAWHTPPLSHRP